MASEQVRHMAFIDWKTAFLLIFGVLSVCWFFLPRYELYANGDSTEIWKLDKVTGHIELCRYAIGPELYGGSFPRHKDFPICSLVHSLPESTHIKSYIPFEVDIPKEKH